MNITPEYTIYPDEGVLFSREESDPSVYWLDDDDQKWLGNSPFIYARVRLMNETYQQSLSLDMVRLAELSQVPKEYTYHWKLLDFEEVTIEAMAEGVVGKCIKFIINPEYYGRQFYDFREAAIITKPCRTVRECGELLLSELVKYLEEQFRKIIAELAHSNKMETEA